MKFLAGPMQLKYERFDAYQAKSRRPSVGDYDKAGAATACIGLASCSDPCYTRTV
jgi:hypothetical protein